MKYANLKNQTHKARNSLIPFIYSILKKKNQNYTKKNFSEYHYLEFGIGNYPQRKLFRSMKLGITCHITVFSPPEK